ncbi:unnamed protein product [Mesocestoides corti]|uniref:RHD domain-containing protein n=1 Tax=Mesocestoides corti TaxID=53468 RepID=A0A0R3U428_MESCO|nr:unnamed protein product [Mesocestoides corti]
MKDEPMHGLVSSQTNCADSGTSIQHFYPSVNWPPNSQHPSAIYDITDASSSASTSPWLQSHHQMDDRFQHPTSRPHSCGHANQYSTPPYNPNGKFDFRYPDPSFPYLIAPRTSPSGISSTMDTGLSIKPVAPYELPLKQTIIQSEHDGYPSRVESPTEAPTYGYSPS